MAKFKTKFSGKFTDFFLDALRKEVEKTPPDKEFDQREVNGSEGFGIRVRRSGVITFFYMYHFGGKRRMMILGTYNDERNKVTLSEARQKYNSAFNSVHQLKVDPMATPADAPEAEMTVEKLAAEFLEKWAAVNYSTRWHDNVKGVLHKYVLPEIGNHAVTAVRRRDLIALLEPLVETKPGQARNVYKAISKMFWYAEDREYLDATPCNRMLNSLPQLSTPSGRERILKDEEIKKVWNRIDRGPGDDSVKRALKFILVTGQRPDEVAGMHRREIDGEWWTIPWKRIKTENKKTLRRKPEDHRVYLTPLALSLVGNEKGFIFPAQPDPFAPNPETALPGQVQRNSLSQRVVRGFPVKRAKGKTIWFQYYGRPHWTPHDLRRSAKTGMSRIGVPDKWSEEVLNHKVDRVRGTYDQHDYDEQKKQALTQWSAHLEMLLNLKKPETA